jgi:4-diphosphocytidyl-2-C-methyl-D-erythritol kinase
MILFPKAKINLGLFITERRADGYHNIESVLYPIGLSDILEIQEKRASDPFFESTGIKTDVSYRENLCYKAYELIRKQYDIPPVAFHLHKIIPLGSGLGGGSSDGACTLKALNTLFDLSIPRGKLMEMAMQLGSDCPFFIDNRPAYVREKGNKIEHTALPLKGKYLAVVVPPIHVSTAEAYRLITPSPRSTPLKQLLADHPPEEWHQVISNDFEPVLLPRLPKLQTIKDQLYQNGALYAALSGSGSSMFGIFDQKPGMINLFPDCFVWEGII